MTTRSRWHAVPSSVALAVLLGGATSCAHVPGAPAGPIGGPSLRLGTTYAFAYSRASAQTLLPSGERRPLRGNGAMFGGSAPFFPLRAMLRASPAPFIDVGADIGWVDAGLQLRAGPLAAGRKLPWGVELEWRTGQLGAYSRDAIRRMRVYGARVEGYPALGAFRGLDVYGALTLGASTGTRWHSMGVTGLQDLSTGEERAALDVAREETRLELSVGVHARGKPMAITVALMPWFALDEGRVRETECSSCELELDGFGAAWGFGLVASGSLVWEKGW